MNAIAPERRAEIVRKAPKLIANIGWDWTAKHFGVSKTTLRRFLNPEFEETLRVQSLEAKRRRRGTCVDCGVETRYAGHGEPGGVARRCPRCAVDASRIWTREEIIAAIQRWDREHGRPPRAHPDWTTRGSYHPASSSVFVSASNPSGVFTSWADAIEAAGFPRPTKGSRPSKYA